jgi:hypothetical protein
MTAVRKLNDAGTQAFLQYVGEVRLGSIAPPPHHLLIDPATSLPIPGSAEVEKRDFASREDAAQYLLSALATVPQDELDHSPPIWNWLSLFFFDQLCPPLVNGHRKVKKAYSYLLPAVSHPEHFRIYYRHLLAGAFRIKRQHPASGKVLLAGALQKFDDFNEQIASRQDLVSNGAVVGALDVLYYDSTTKRPKRGAGSNKRKPGTLRRFVDVLQQFEMTYDLHSLTTDQLLDLLPKEFDRWMPRTGEVA